MTHRVSFGVTPIQTGVDFHHIREVALRAEELGYDSVWLNDHFFTSRLFHPLPPPTAPFYESWVTLSALAALTRRVRIGTLCSNVSFRNPALLAKMAACLDVISGGRLELGLGAGWFEDEHTAYGFAFPDMARRAQQLTEAVDIIKRMWAEETVTFDGRWFRTENAYCSPKPLQSPRPPITIGARGSRTMLRVAARCADRWNIQTPISPAQYRRKLGFLGTALPRGRPRPRGDWTLAVGRHHHRKGPGGIRPGRGGPGAAAHRVPGCADRGDPRRVHSAHKGVRGAWRHRVHPLLYP